MLVAALLAATGFLTTAIVTRRYGLRLGGTIVIGVLTVYTLKSFSTLPIFLVSTAVAYLALDYVKRNTLIYGRDEFVVAILAGSLLPALVYLAVFYLPGNVQTEIYQSVFIGSLLSGIAAFNIHQVQPGYRRRDIGGGLGLYLGLLVLGAVLVGPSTRFLAGYTPLVLFASTSDIAVLRGAVVSGFVDPAFVGRPFVIGVYVLALGISEYVRNAFGVHIGAVAVGLLAIYTVSTWRLLAVFLVTLVLVFLALSFIHEASILYGRALLSTGAAIGTLLTLPLMAAFGVSSGISMLFTGILAGILGYYVHRTPARERRMQFALGVSAFTLMLVLVRAVVSPAPEGFPQTFGAFEAAVGVVVVVTAFAVARSYRVPQPEDDAVRSTSVFTRGGE